MLDHNEIGLARSDKRRKKEGNANCQSKSQHERNFREAIISLTAWPSHVACILVEGVVGVPRLDRGNSPMPVVSGFEEPEKEGFITEIA